MESRNFDSSTLQKQSWIRRWHLTLSNRWFTEFLDNMQWTSNGLDLEFALKGDFGKCELHQHGTRYLAWFENSEPKTKSTEDFPMNAWSIQSYSRSTFYHDVFCKIADSLEWTNVLSPYVYLWTVFLWRNQEIDWSFSDWTCRGIPDGF